MSTVCRRRWFVPEVVQTSAMDCGPATLKALLEGHGIPVSYGRLREICHTSVDGTSIDTLEDLANSLGLESEQWILPPEHVLDTGLGTLPALAVTRLPSGLTHFVVIWRRLGPLVQVMDPSRGRHFMRAAALEEELYIHESTLPEEDVRQFVESAPFLDPVRRRCRSLGLPDVDGMLHSAREQGWGCLAALDAALRATSALVREGAIRGRSSTQEAFSALYESARGNSPFALVARTYWSFLPADTDGEVVSRGAIILKAMGHARRSEDADTALRARASKEGPGVWATFRALLGDIGARGLVPVVFGLVAVGAGTLLEALLFRGAFDIGQRLTTLEQKMAAVAGLAVLLIAFLCLELPLGRALTFLGRRLEIGLRRAFVRKLPRLGDAYFQSRPMSSMAEMSHLLHWVRLLPPHAGQAFRCAAELLATLAGLVWLHPPSAPLVAFVGLFMFVFPFATQPFLLERDLRMRGHAGGLSRFYLDALLGSQAIRAHTAEPAILTEHGSRLREWARSALTLCRTQVGLDLFAGMVGFAFTGWLVADYLRSSTGTGWALLYVYWSFFVPLLGQELAFLVQQYPQHRNITLRLLEPIGADETPSDACEEAAPDREKRGVEICLRDLAVEAGGLPVLDIADLRVHPGEHIAVVGGSGAGKSTLASVLLGFHVPCRGGVHIDGERLEGAVLGRLRRDTVWVDPTGQLWNASLLDNLRFGADPGLVSEAMQAAQIEEILGRLPMGLQTPLGASGGRLSGGEGQRVRLGRGFARPLPRLVLLDEAFCGLERPRRSAMLQAARERFAHSTFLCITHDLMETRMFPRVLVLCGGRIVEDGAPSELLGRPASQYRALLAAEERALARLRGPRWRTLRVEGGRVVEEEKT